MTGCEAPRISALDAYIRTQLAKAAETHASYIGIGVWLEAALGAGRNDDHDGTPAANS